MDNIDTMTGDDTVADKKTYQSIFDCKIQEQNKQTEICSDQATDGYIVENMTVAEKLHITGTISDETFDNSDAGSWNSDTPLLPNKSEEFPCTKDGTNIGEVDNINTNVSADIDHIVIEVTEKIDGSAFGSGSSIAFSVTHDADDLRTNPIHPYGSSWGFGSVCSINLYGSGDVFRSRINTSDQHGFSNQTSAGQDRLLSRIFKENIGSMQHDKTTDKDLVKFISSKQNDIPTDISYPAKTKNLKNLLILSTSITFLHIAVYGLRNLQSSMNSESGLGVYSLATLYGAFMFGSLASPFVVQRYQPKICLSISCFGHLVYVIANYFPRFYIFIPASVVHGLSNALLWNALCTYITEIGLDEAFCKSKVVSNVLSRYFGIFFLALQMSMVLGNLFSSLILSESDNRIRMNQSKTELSYVKLDATTITYSFPTHFMSAKTIPKDANESTFETKCGAGFCDIDTHDKEKPAVDDLNKLFLLGTYSSCAVISILVIQCFLEKLPNYSPYSSTLMDAIKQAGSVVVMVIDKKFCFIVVLCLYTVISNGFVIADILKAFITCPLGVRMVGYSMICFGICGSASSYMFGKLTKCTGNIAAFLTGRSANAVSVILCFVKKVLLAAVLNLTLLALMVTWKPSPEDQYLLFAFVGTWGFADGIWQSQINSLISSMFADRYETAFGCCRVLQGLAGIIVFTMSNMMCMLSKIIFTAATCLLSVMLYVVMEMVGKKTRGP